MNTQLIKTYKFLSVNHSGGSWLKRAEPVLLFVILLLLWFVIHQWLYSIDKQAGSLDPNISLLIILSLITFFIICSLCWWLLQHFWTVTGLPELKHMVSQFKILAPWQQLGLYWLSFVSVLLAALGCLIAIC